MKLTKTAVQKVQPETKKRFFYDEIQPGLGLVVHPSGKKSFFFQYRTAGGRGGTSKRVTIGAFPGVTCGQARQKAREMSAEVFKGGDPGTARKTYKDGATVQVAIEEFMKLHVIAKRKSSTARNYEIQTRLHVVPVIGNLKIRDVTHSHIQKIHFGLRETPYQANRTLAMLSKFFFWCEQNGYRDRGTNPASGIDKFKELKKTRFMDEKTLGKIGSALEGLESQGRIDPFAAGAIRVLLLTGARLNEVLSLQWKDLDLDKGLAYLEDSKTGWKVLHLGAPAVTVLSSLQRVNEWVFPSRKKEGHLINLRKTWVVVCEHAGVGNWRIHDLRHAFASLAASSGHSLPMIGAVLGHTQAATTHRYSHLGANPVHEVANSTAELMKNALRGKKAGPLM